MERMKGIFRRPHPCPLPEPESTEESWNLCRSVGEGRGKVAVRV